MSKTRNDPPADFDHDDVPQGPAGRPLAPPLVEPRYVDDVEMYEFFKATTCCPSPRSAASSTSWCRSAPPWSTACASWTRTYNPYPFALIKKPWPDCRGFFCAK